MRVEFASTINNFLNGSVSLAALQEWLLSNLQAILDSGDSVAIHAANEIDADLIGLGEKLVDETDFISRLQSLRDMLQTITFQYSETTVLATTHESTGAESRSFKATSGPEDFRFHRIVESAAADR